MDLAQKLRHLRDLEGHLRGLGRAMTQGELLRAVQAEQGQTLSQSYLSQLESGTRPHLTNTSRLLLARFFKVHPGYLVEDPEGYHPELLSELRHEVTSDDRLDVWLAAGAERFSQDGALCEALEAVAAHPESRRCLLLLRGLLAEQELFDRLAAVLQPQAPSEAPQSAASPIAQPAPATASQGRRP